MMTDGFAEASEELPDPVHREFLEHLCTSLGLIARTKWWASEIKSEMSPTEVHREFREHL